MYQTRTKRGFTLIELLVVIAIIGIIAVILIPNFLDAINKARQKRTMQDMKETGTAMMSWLSDNVSSSAAGASGPSFDVGSWQGTSDLAAIRQALVPSYIQEIKDRDGWKHSYTYRLDLLNPQRQQIMLIGSGGFDGNAVSGTYAIGSFDPTDYKQDLVWADGGFLRRPN